MITIYANTTKTKYQIGRNGKKKTNFTYRSLKSEVNNDEYIKYVQEKRIPNINVI